MANLAQIYDWFMTGKKPTQAQFWASWGSFWNKEETIPQSAISNLTSVLSAKTENTQFNAHKTATDAHAELFLQQQTQIDSINAIIENLDGPANPYTTFKRIQKGFGNINLSVDELGDIFCGWSNDGTVRYPEAEWLGGALNNSDNFKPLITVIIEN